MRTCFLFLILSFSSICRSQNVQKLKFEKDSSLIYFFCKGSKTDTIIKNINNTFYLIVPNSLKKQIYIEVENGQLLKTENDSLIQVHYMPGLKYESQYIISESRSNKESKKITQTYELISLINGTSSYPSNKLRVQIINKAKDQDQVLLENSFYFIEKH